MLYVDVAVDASVPYHHPFSYAVPPGIHVQVGYAVLVPFGRRVLQGVVMTVSDAPSYPETRNIQALIDPRPLISPQHVTLSRWISEHYLAPLFSAVTLMLPPGFQRHSVTVLRPLVSAEDAQGLALTPQQREVLERALARRRVELEALATGGDRRGLRAAVEQLERQGLLSRTYELSRPRVGPKVITCARLLLPLEEAIERISGPSWRRAESAIAALHLLAEQEPALPVSKLREATGISLEQVRRLEKQGILVLEKVAQQRDPLAGYAVAPDEPLPLTERQQAALEEIQEAMADAAAQGPSTPARVFLLHGVTGSGKTEVYLHALASAVAMGHRAIVLVPEIALTPQTVQRFAQRFPGKVAVMHSGLSPGELYDQWHRIRDGRYVVVIGPRSALFAPQPDLGLIIIDEEHETTYRQEEPAPRYHTRAVAEKLAELTGAVLVLGSATPAVESYHRAKIGRYRLLELHERVSTDGGNPTVILPLPRVQVVDMRQEIMAGNRSIFSRVLQESIAETLAAGEQVILFLNRRGTAAFIQCRSCGHVPRCSGCDLSLTYHAAEERLVCHYCRRQRRLPSRCPMCSGMQFRQLGVGTQRVEQEAAQLFPAARLLRWDLDVTRERGAHERILSRFRDREADILIGTQMVAKGLDLPAVTSVGVISADVTLNLPDYRSGERTFQLLTQVAGRAGRGSQGGYAIIQTYSPQHYVIRAAASHDYAAFYQQEAIWRHRYGYPPFARLARLTYAHYNREYAAKEAQRVLLLLRQKRDTLGLPNLDVRGPAPAFIPRLRGRYRWQLLLRGDNPNELLGGVNLSQGWTVDVDPVSLL